MDTKKLESLGHRPKCSDKPDTTCWRCGGTNGKHKQVDDPAAGNSHMLTEMQCPFDPVEIAKLKPKPESKPIVTITAQHAASLAALVEHWKELIKFLEPIMGVGGFADGNSGGLGQRYCDEMLEDLKE